jgi:hypothetical protein
MTRTLDAESDAATWTDYVGQLVAVSNEGSTLGDTLWLSQTAPGGTLNTTSITYVQIQSGLSVIGDSVYTTKVGNELELILAPDITSGNLPSAGSTMATITTGGAHVVKSALTHNGTLTTWTLTHNLGTQQVDVLVQANNSGVPGVPWEVDWSPATANTVTITFASALTSGTSFFVTVIG